MYVSCTKSAGSAAAAGTCPFVVPFWISNGTYELRLFANNVFTLLATSNPFTVGPSNSPVVTIAVTEGTAVVIAMMDTLLVELTAMPDVTIAMAAAETSVVVAAEDTLIVMTEVTAVPLATHRQQPPMVIQLLVERLESHMEVEATMMRDTPVVNIDR